MTGVADAAAMIAALRLAPHPEGGWYRETWRVAAREPGGRSQATAILFLLEAGQASHWHRVDASELWLFQAGTPLELAVSEQPGRSDTVTLGAEPLVGHLPQHLVPPHAWQSARASITGWALVACVVVPGFDFSGFEMARPGWAP